MNLSWRDHPSVRVAGAAASWFLFSLSFSLLYQSSFALLALGGSCASGGPYEIAVECPDTVALFTPLSIYGGLLAVAIAIFFARGFGTPLTTWAWPVLFVGLGLVFLLAFILGGDVTGLVIGGVFIIMGLVPLGLELYGSPQRVFLGQKDARGVQFFEGARARRSLLSPATPNPENAVQPTFAHWALALSVTLVPIVLGWTLALAWFS